MSIFTKYTEASAAAGAAEVLSKVKARYGFIPNLAADVAESPLVLEAVLSLAAAFDKVSLTPQEQQTVLLTVSALNGCVYCRTVHTALGRKVVEESGRVKEDDVRTFLAHGFTKVQVFEVILGVALKTLTNYCNHLAGAVPNAEFVAMAEGQAAA